MDSWDEFSSRDPDEIFQILAKLGEGSYGSVFKALDNRDGMIVAVKVLDLDGTEDAADLMSEIKILKHCACVNVVAYKGSFKKDQSIWIAMEYCGAGSVCDLMAICDKSLTEDQIACIMHMSLKGLVYLHSQKKIHRDIKSGNILLNIEGEAKLADFGVSAELSHTMGKRQTVIGTPYWMAPEVLRSEDYDGKADVWSLGITAFELATGDPPLAEVHPMRAIFLIPTAPTPELPNDQGWSAKFQDFINVCLRKEIDKRPSALELLQHPFVRNAADKAPVAELVEVCIDEIEDFRAAEMAELESEANRGTWEVGSMGTSSQLGTLSSSSTMKSSGSFASLQHSIPSGSPTSSGTLSRSPLSSSATFGKTTLSSRTPATGTARKSTIKLEIQPSISTVSKTAASKLVEAKMGSMKRGKGLVMAGKGTLRRTKERTSSRRKTFGTLKNKQQVNANPPTLSKRSKAPPVPNVASGTFVFKPGIAPLDKPFFIKQCLMSFQRDASPGSRKQAWRSQREMGSAKKVASPSGKVFWNGRVYDRTSTMNLIANALHQLNEAHDRETFFLESSFNVQRKQIQAWIANKRDASM